MTKFALTTWFCKTVAAFGMMSGLLSMVGSAVFLLFRSIGFGGSILGGLLTFASYLFVWLFAQGIGSALAGEDRYQSAPLSYQDLSGLTIRCAGFYLALSAFISTSQQSLSLVYALITKSSLGASYSTFLASNVAMGIVQIILGLVLAFVPRLLRLPRS